VLAQDALDEPAQIGPDILADRPINRHVGPHCRFDELFEEELVELVKVRAEALVDEIDQLRERRPVVNPLSSWKTWYSALRVVELPQRSMPPITAAQLLRSL
jgi:hypothetical protein